MKSREVESKSFLKEDKNKRLQNKERPANKSWKKWKNKRDNRKNNLLRNLAKSREKICKKKIQITLSIKFPTSKFIDYFIYCFIRYTLYSFVINSHHHEFYKWIIVVLNGLWLQKNVVYHVFVLSLQCLYSSFVSIEFLKIYLLRRQRVGLSLRFTACYKINLIMIIFNNVKIHHQVHYKILEMKIHI